MKLSKHFSRNELECKCCGRYVENTALLIALEYVRDKLGPVTVTSGTRCENHNKAVGGAPGSKHLLGQAADIQVKGAHPRVVYSCLEESGFSNLIGLGLYTKGGFVHVDVRGNAARW